MKDRDFVQDTDILAEDCRTNHRGGRLCLSVAERCGHRPLQKLLMHIAIWAVAAMTYLFWFLTEEPVLLDAVSALAFLAGFLCVCLAFLQRPFPIETSAPESADKNTYLRIFFLFLGVALGYLLLVTALEIIVYQEISLSPWLHLDSEHYIHLAEHGYRKGSATLVFLPGYPLMIRLVALFVKDYVLAAFFVSLLFFSLSGPALYALLRLDYQHQESMRIIRYLLLCPGVFFFAAPMSESMFFFFAILCFYFVRQKKVLLGCILGGIAAFTRSLGFLLIFPVLIELWPQEKSWKKLLPSLLIPFGFFCYCLLCLWKEGHLFGFLYHQKESWHQEAGFFFGKMAEFFRLSLTSLHNPSQWFGFYLPNLLSGLVPLLLMVLGCKKLRPSYVSWFLPYYALALGVTSLLSGPRYMLVCLPVYLTLVPFTKNRYINRMMTAIFAFAALAYTYAFVTVWNVW